jgi:hypothetical protein
LPADISNLQSTPKMYSPQKPIPPVASRRSMSFLRDTNAVLGNKAVLHRSSQLTDWLFLERYVSIVWTRRRVRDEQTKVKLVLGLLVSSAKGGVQSTDTASSLSRAVCGISLGESNSNFQLPRFDSCVGPPVIGHQGVGACARMTSRSCV